MTDMPSQTAPASGIEPGIETRFPLLFHTSAEQIIAYRDGAPSTVGEFMEHVHTVAAWLPDGAHVFNVCADRYVFTVGLCATLLAGKTSLLPSTHTPEMVRQLATFAPDAFCLHDREDSGIALPSWRMPVLNRATDPERGMAHESSISPAAQARDRVLNIPAIEASRLMAYVFTSGSTGLPVPHRKTWGFLVSNIRAAAHRLGLVASAGEQTERQGEQRAEQRAHRHAENQTWQPSVTLIGTVPPQHMYGFESTVLLALLGGLAFSNRQPFYPQDIRAELEAIPGNRVLVTSPVHLRALLQSSPQVPEASLLLSATAPLAHKLAVEAEAAFGAPLIEIYGSTETGQIATRRTAQTDSWQLFPEVRLVEAPDLTKTDVPDECGGATNADEPEVFWVSGGHVEQPVPMGDVLEAIDASHFRLLGRRADMINIAGKRSSLAYLNHQLNAVDGVLDGAFYMPDLPAATVAAGQEPPVIRPVAFVVAPHRTTAELVRDLRQRIDIVFMPRPLCQVESLPRNGTGKLTHEVLAQLYVRHVARATVGSDGPGVSITVPPGSAGSIAFMLDAQHPARAGHFPGQPIVPGVVLLDHALSLLATATGQAFELGQIAAAKFPHPARFGQPLQINYQRLPSGALRFSVEQNASVVASGTLAHPR